MLTQHSFDFRRVENVFSSPKGMDELDIGPGQFPTQFLRWILLDKRIVVLGKEIASEFRRVGQALQPSVHETRVTLVLEATEAT